MKKLIVLFTLILSFSSFASEVEEKTTNMLAQMVAETSAEEVGALLEAICTVDAEELIQCTFKYDLPVDYCWYGYFAGSATVEVVEGEYRILTSRVEWEG